MPRADLGLLLTDLMHYQCEIVSAILILRDLLSIYFSKWLVATWNGLFLT